jgi:hypothetical protein
VTLPLRFSATGSLQIRGGAPGSSGFVPDVRAVEVKHLVLRIESGDTVEDHHVARLVVPVPEKGDKREFGRTGRRFKKRGATLVYSIFTAAAPPESSLCLRVMIEGLSFGPATEYVGTCPEALDSMMGSSRRSLASMATKLLNQHRADQPTISASQNECSIAIAATTTTSAFLQASLSKCLGAISRPLSTLPRGISDQG